MGTQMTDQFDLEQGIMSCWNVTSDLDTLLEELMENQTFTKDQASNFVLGLSTIYEAKFDKLFRTFEDFLKQYYKQRNELKQAREEISTLREFAEEAIEEVDRMREANELAADAALATKSMEELFLEQEQENYQRMMDENDAIAFGLIEDEEAPV